MKANELSADIWPSECESRSWGARRVREVARQLFPEDAPGHGRPWEFSRAEADTIKREALHRWGRTPPRDATGIN